MYLIWDDLIRKLLFLQDNNSYDFVRERFQFQFRECNVNLQSLSHSIHPYTFNTIYER